MLLQEREGNNFISILLPDLRGGGAERVSIDLAHAFAAFGHEVEFALMRAEGEFLPEARARFAVTDLDVVKTRFVPLPVASYLRRRRPSAIIVHMWPLTSAVVMGRAIARVDAPVLLVEHNTLSRQYAEWGKLHNTMMRASLACTYRFADKVAAVSAGAADDTARLASLPSDRVSVLHNPIPSRNAPSAEECEIAERLWNCPRGHRLLAVGSLKLQKNQRMLLHAFAKTSLPQSRLMLLGQGEEETALRELALRLGVGERVIFAGFHHDPSAFYESADLLVLSSDYEGLPTVLIEALSFGLPVISTDCPSGPAEILGNGRWGRLVPVGDADALARAMEAALSEPVDRAALKRRAADFAPEIAARKYLDLLGL